VHLPRRRDVDERRREAGGECRQEQLGRVRAGIRAAEDGRLAGVDVERLGPRGVLLPGAVEAADRPAVVGAGDPLVRDPELEPPEGRVCGNRVESVEELRRVDAVADRVRADGDGLRLLLPGERPVSSCGAYRTRRPLIGGWRGANPGLTTTANGGKPSWSGA
jgi:hypothetical protein